MKQESRKRFSPEFKVESAQLVIDQGYTVREAADAMG
jgi:transposase